ncbi:hypothetical protein N431DRAFT_498960 [Stipitochalara longipes BDJ]|nr:hypothetical protein N431DRAFT_498960 [Stipitochalara longipes BDJ]
MSWLLLALFVSSLHAVAVLSKGHTQIVPSTAFSGNVNMDTISSGHLDAPHLSAVNTSAFEWWYFDAVSTDLSSAINVVFYTALASGFGGLEEDPIVTVVEIDFVFPNGTTNTIWLNASEAVITTEGQGASAVWKDAGAKFTGASNLSRYTVEINSPNWGVVGTFHLKTLAPAHYACGKAESGQPMTVAPNVGWSNAIPDATGEVDLHVNGERFQFQGSAYHDHNWGVEPVQEDVLYEHWGHGHLGDYSLVWFTITAPDSTNHSSIYVAAHDKIVTASCGPNAFSLTPTYNHRNASEVTGYEMEVNLDSGDVLSVQIHIHEVALDGSPIYMRWIGSMQGRLNGGEEIRDGAALFEMFDLSYLQ